MHETDEQLTDLGDVVALVLGAVEPLGPVEIDLSESLRSVLAIDVRALEDLPPFDNSAMDGYALRSADVRDAPTELEVVGVIAAGTAPGRGIGPGETMQIMTGAAVPDGADAVGIVERSEPGSRPASVRILDAVEPGQNLRPAGDDLKKGDLGLASGTRLGPAQISLLASVGAGTVLVTRPPKVGVLSTGDELVGAGRPMRLGQIRDSNRPGLLAQLALDGFDAVDLGTKVDDLAEISGAIRHAMTVCDALVTSGGVSMGEFDFVKVAVDEIVGELGGETHQLKVAIRPAKPLSFAVVRPQGRAAFPIFGLPGNPVSSMVSYQVIARRALAKMGGGGDDDARIVTGVAPDGLARHPDGKIHLVRVVARVDETGRICLRSSGAQGSHHLASAALANALAFVPDGSGIEPGGTVRALLTGPLDAD